LPLKAVTDEVATSPTFATCSTTPPLFTRTLLRRAVTSTWGEVPSDDLAWIAYQRGLAAGAVELDGALDLRVVQLDRAGGDGHVGADLAAHGQRLQALQHAGVGGGRLRQALQGFRLRQLRQLVYVGGRVLRRQRVLVLDLGDQQLGEHVAVGVGRRLGLHLVGLGGARGRRELAVRGGVGLHVSFRPV
jgi:hypothetical protein